MTKMLTTTQRNAMKRGRELAEAAMLLTGYLRKVYERSDEHLGRLLYLVERARLGVEDASEAVFYEHDRAENAAKRKAARVTPIGDGKRTRKAVRRG
jgi:hypothetical protein